MVSCLSPINNLFLSPDRQSVFDEDHLSSSLLAPRIYHHSKSPSSSKKIDDYHWTFLLIVRECSMIILKTIIACFQWLLKHISSSENREFKDKEIENLFNHQIDYDRFRDEILSYRKKGDLFYNNFGLKSYLQLKEDIIADKLEKIEKFSDDDKRDWLAGIANYQAIVDLFVQRFLVHHPDLDQEPYLSALRFTALCIAIKLSYDQPIWNSDFISFLKDPLPLLTHNKMELEFLRVIDWHISFSDICSDHLPDLE